MLAQRKWRQVHNLVKGAAATLNTHTHTHTHAHKHLTTATTSCPTSHILHMFGYIVAFWQKSHLIQFPPSQMGYPSDIYIYISNIYVYICMKVEVLITQLCPTLCNPTDSSPTGSSIPGILQARILEWVAISFSNAWKWKVKVKSLSCLTQRPHGLQPTRLLRPWDFPGKSTGVGCHCLLRPLHICIHLYIGLPWWLRQ